VLWVEQGAGSRGQPRHSEKCTRSRVHGEIPARSRRKRGPRQDWRQDCKVDLKGPSTYRVELKFIQETGQRTELEANPPTDLL